MNQDLATVLSLKSVLESASEGAGMSRSVVEKLSEAHSHGRESAKLILLGFPLPVALRPLLESPSPEVSMIASLAASAPRSSAVTVGKTGRALASTLGGWVRSRETRKLEMKVLRFRGLIASGVLGAVTAMLATLGPLVGSLDFTSPGQSVGAVPLLYAAGAMACLSSAMLGMYLSGRGLVANVSLTLVVFAVVAVASSPLASIPAVGLWGIK